MNPVCIRTIDYFCSYTCYLCKRGEKPKPIYTLIPARNIISFLNGSGELLIGWYCIEKTKFESNISLGLPAIYGAKFISV